MEKTLVEKFLSKKEDDIKSQQEMLSLFSDALNNSPIYNKYKPVLVSKEPMQGGEEITTITSDGIETINVAEAGDILVQNQTETGEQYLIKPDVFSSRYVKSDYVVKSRYWDEYIPIGKCRAFEYTGDLSDEFLFYAPWNEPMVCKLGDMLCTTDIEGPLTEIYRIAKKEFDETYELDTDFIED